MKPTLSSPRTAGTDVEILVKHNVFNFTPHRAQLNASEQRKQKSGQALRMDELEGGKWLPLRPVSRFARASRTNKRVG